MALIRRSRAMPLIVGADLIPAQYRRARRAGKLWPAPPPPQFSFLATDFDGVNQHAQFTAPNNVASRFDFDLRSVPMSLSLWFKVTGGPLATLETLIGKMSGSAVGYRLTLIPGGVLEFIARGGATTDRFVVDAAASGLDDGEWHHVAVTVDGSGNGNGVTYYVDGSVSGPTVIGDNGLVSTTVVISDFMVADRDFDAPGPTAFAGLIDDPAIYQTELSAGEAAAVWGGGRPPDLRLVGPFLNGLIGYWFMGDLDAFNTIQNRANPAPYDPSTTAVDLNNDTVNEFLDFTDYAAATFGKADPFSGGVWIKYGPSNFTSFALLGKNNDLNGASFKGWTFYTTNFGGINLDFQAASGDIISNGQNSTGLNSEEWEHIAFTYDGSNLSTGMKLYRNGELLNSNPSGGSLTGDIDVAGELRVGKQALNFDDFFVGIMKHSHLYNVELTPEEMKSAFGSGVQQDLDVVLASRIGNKVHHCALGDGDAIGAGNMIDLSGNANGTFINGEGGDFVADVPLLNAVGALTMVNMAADDFVADTA